VKQIFISCVLLIAYCHTFATGTDSSLYKKYYGFRIQYVYANDFDHAISLDSSLSGFQMYDPSTTNFGNVEIGNFGYATYSEIFTPPVFTDFDLGLHQFDPYLFSTDKTKYYYAVHPMTQVQYTIASKGEQMLTLSHTQNINRNWNVGLDLNILRSSGFYTHQRTDYTNLDAYTWYKGKKQHYNLFASFVINDEQVRENGGVKNDSVFIDPSIFIKTLAPIRLDTAENFLRSYSVSVQQSWDIGSYTDITINDSTIYKKLVPVLRIQDNITYTSSLYRYTDDSSDNSFYSTIAKNNLLTMDSLSFKHFSNAIGFSVLDKQDQFLPALFTNNRLTASFNTDWYSIKQSALDTSFLTLGLRASYYTNVVHPNSIFYDLSGGYSILNFNKNIYKLTASVGFAFKDSTSTITATANSYSTPPSFVSTYFNSNFNNWNNNFNLEKIQSLVLIFNLPKWKTNFTITLYNVSDYIYWGSQITQPILFTPPISFPVPFQFPVSAPYNDRPYQLSSSINTLIFYLQKDIKFFKNFHFNNRLLYQDVLSQANYVHLPSFVLRTSLYYGNDLFKHALHSEIGIDVNYNTAFDVPNYMPETGQFFLQYSTEYPTYPVADFFISIRIKTLRAFFKVANFDQNVFEPGYFTALHYPMPDLNFQAGFNWTFRN